MSRLSTSTADTPADRALAWATTSIELGRATDHNWLATLNSFELSDDARRAIRAEHTQVDQLLLDQLSELGVTSVSAVFDAIRAVVPSAEV